MSLRALAGRKGALCALLIIAGGAVWLVLSRGTRLWQSPKPAPEHPLAEINPLGYDFGTVLPGSTLQAEFEVRNRGRELLQIVDVETSCGCAPASIDRTEIAGGQRARVTVQFRAPLHPGEVSHRLFFSTNDPKRRQVSLPLRGVAQWPVEAEPTAMRFPAVPMGEEAQRELELYSTDASAFRVIEVITGAPWLKVREVERNARRVRYRVSVRPPELGGFSGMIQFVTTTKGRPRIMVPVRGEAVGDVTITPKSLLLGLLRPGSQTTVHLVLRCRSNNPDVTSVRIRDPGWEITGWEQDQKNEHLAVVSATLRAPELTGYQRTAMLLESATWNGAVEIPVSGLLGSPSSANAD